MIPGAFTGHALHADRRACPVNHDPRRIHRTRLAYDRRACPRRDHFGVIVRRAASRAISIRELTPSFLRMWETWVATVRRDSSSLAAISGLDRPSPTS